jgi:RNA polymerase sigma factor (sigma-70 family)
MPIDHWLAEQFEASRAHLKAVAYRMLGSGAEADDALQECWLRVSGADTSVVENPQGWLTAVLARICLNMLRSRRSRREEYLDAGAEDPHLAASRPGDPQNEALLAESVGLALLVVLERLNPAERVAFVLHDVFGATFDEIAPIVSRSPQAARQLASRARRRVRGGAGTGDAGSWRQSETVEKFLRALRAGDMDGLLAVLDPHVVRKADAAALRPGAARELRGAAAVAAEAMAYSRSAGAAQAARVDESAGFVVAPRGQLRIAVRCVVRNGRIARMDVTADPRRLARLKLTLSPERGENSAPETIRE